MCGSVNLATTYTIYRHIRINNSVFLIKYFGIDFVTAVCAGSYLFYTHMYARFSFSLHADTLRILFSDIEQHVRCVLHNFFCIPYLKHTIIIVMLLSLSLSLLLLLSFSLFCSCPLVRFSRYNTPFYQYHLSDLSMECVYGE